MLIFVTLNRILGDIFDRDHTLYSHRASALTSDIFALLSQKNITFCAAEFNSFWVATASHSARTVDLVTEKTLFESHAGPMCFLARVRIGYTGAVARFSLKETGQRRIRPHSRRMGREKSIHSFSYRYIYSCTHVNMSRQI